MNIPSGQSALRNEGLSLIIITALLAVSPFTMEMYLPAMKAIALELGSSVVQVNYTITTFLVGAALGETIGGPISDQLGRKRNVLFGLSVFVFATIGIALSHDILSIQILRFLQALGAGFAVVVGLPTLRDMFDPKTAAQKMPLVAAATMVAPMIAPVIGTALMQIDWRAIFWFLAFYGFVVAVLFMHYVPAGKGTKKQFSVAFIKAQYTRVITFRAHGKPVAFYYVLLQGFLAGVFLTFLTNAAWIYLDHFGVAVLVLPLFFLIHTGSTFAGNIMISRLIKFIDVRSLIQIGTLLQLSAIATMFVLAVFGSLSLLAFSMLFVPLMVGANMMNTSLRALLLGYFQDLTGSAISLLSLSRYTFGALGGLISGLLFNHTMFPILAIMLLSAGGAFILITQFLPKNTLKEIASLERPEGY